jgi:hypothetical protein
MLAVRQLAVPDVQSPGLLVMVRLDFRDAEAR